MQIQTVLALLAVVAGVSANPELERAGYTIEELSWEIQTHPNGPLVTLNGTAEEVYAHATKLNPRYAEDFPAPSEEELAKHSLDKRADFAYENIHCLSFDIAPAGEIRNGAKYLSGLSGRPSHGPGPSACARVSCSGGNAGIYWCNDAPVRKELAGWGSIVDGVNAILSKCTVQIPSGIRLYPDAFVRGQAFHTTQWNVIVSKTDCSKP